MAKNPFMGNMGGLNMNNLMKQAQKLQQQMEEMKGELELKHYTASTGGGAVEVTVTGKKQLVGIKIKPEVVDPDDVEMLQDLIVLACNEALKKAEEETAGEMQKITGGMGMPGMF